MINQKAMSKKGNRPTINGVWLQQALKAQGHTLSSAAKLIDINNGILYSHKDGRITISTGVLFALCTALPTLSERYVLTGRGPMVLPSSETAEKVLLESFQIKQSINRILDILTT